MTGRSKKPSAKLETDDKWKLEIDDEGRPCLIWDRAATDAHQEHLEHMAWRMRDSNQIDLGELFKEFPDWFKRTNMLMQHYKVQQGDVFSLALHLAIDFVPGFKKPYLGKKGGRRKDPGRRPALIAGAVDVIKKEYPSITKNSEACLIWAACTTNHKNPALAKLLAKLHNRTIEVKALVDQLPDRTEVKKLARQLENICSGLKRRSDGEPVKLSVRSSHKN